MTYMILKISFKCQHFKKMGMSQRYTEAEFSLVDMSQR